MLTKSLATVAAFAGALALSGAAQADRPGRGGGHGGGQFLTCNSGNYDFNFCGTSQRVRSAELVRRRSDASCRFGSSWGFTRDGIWVDNGCRAEFRINAGGYNQPVEPRGYGGGYGGGHGGGNGGGYGGGHGGGPAFGGGPVYGGPVYGGGGGGNLAQRALEICESYGARRAHNRGARDFRLSRRIQVDGARGQGWRVWGPASVERRRGRIPLYVDCYVRRFEVVNFDVSLR